MAGRREEIRRERENSFIASDRGINVETLFQSLNPGPLPSLHDPIGASALCAFSGISWGERWKAFFNLPFAVCCYEWVSSSAPPSLCSYFWSLLFPPRPGPSPLSLFYQPNVQILFHRECQGDHICPRDMHVYCVCRGDLKSRPSWCFPKMQQTTIALRDNAVWQQLHHSPHHGRKEPSSEFCSRRTGPREWCTTMPPSSSSPLHSFFSLPPLWATKMPSKIQYSDKAPRWNLHRVVTSESAQE